MLIWGNDHVISIFKLHQGYLMLPIIRRRFIMWFYQLVILESSKARSEVVLPSRSFGENESAETTSHNERGSGSKSLDNIKVQKMVSHSNTKIFMPQNDVKRGFPIFSQVFVYLVFPFVRPSLLPRVRKKHEIHGSPGGDWKSSLYN